MNLRRRPRRNLFVEHKQVRRRRIKLSSALVVIAAAVIFFTIGGTRVGSAVVNRIRLVLAVVFLSVTHFLLTGQWFPADVEPYRWGWLGLSGIIGLVIGDSMLFRAFVMIGPRLSMLLMSLVPIISAALAWVFLEEKFQALPWAY